VATWFAHASIGVDQHSLCTVRCDSPRSQSTRANKRIANTPQKWQHSGWDPIFFLIAEFRIIEQLTPNNQQPFCILSTQRTVAHFVPKLTPQKHKNTEKQSLLPLARPRVLSFCHNSTLPKLAPTPN